MLIVTRRVDEAIIIDGRIRVVIVEIRNGQKVRIGIEADPSIPVNREEIQAIIDREKRQAPPESHTP